jgi:drug/metabolite transporter (DMT)-like permease
MFEKPPRWQVLLAFSAIYFIWGSSYLGVRFAIQSIPPFLMGGSRFMIAGTILMLLARWQGAAWPSRANWRSASILGVLFFLIANGAVIWASQYLPSGTIAIMGATIPMWTVVLDWLVYRSVRPGLIMFIGVGLGLAGVVMLISPGDVAGGEPLYAPAAVALLIGPACWGIGSLYARDADLPKSPTMSTGMQLFAGGLILLVIGLVTGEQFDASQVTLRSGIAFVYLITFASIVAFSAFVWLLRVTTPARVSTYAFVNPVVAVFLGAILASETLTPRTLIAAAIILAGVVMIILYRAQGEFQWRAPVKADQTGNSA